MSIRIYGATSGYVDLDAPAVAGSASVTLPGSGTLALYSQLKVLQVVYANTNTETAISSTSYTDSGLSASITPSSTSSKILVVGSQNMRVQRQSNDDVYGNLQILRGSTSIIDIGAVMRLRAALGVDSYVVLHSTVPFLYLDSPASTSSVTYKTQVKVNTTANSGSVITQPSGYSQITLMEIAA